MSISACKNTSQNTSQNVLRKAVVQEEEKKPDGQAIQAGSEDDEDLLASRQAPQTAPRLGMGYIREGFSNNRYYNAGYREHLLRERHLSKEALALISTLIPKDDPKTDPDFSAEFKTYTIERNYQIQALRQLLIISVIMRTDGPLYQTLLGLYESRNINLNNREFHPKRKSQKKKYRQIIVTLVRVIILFIYKSQKSIY
jgi:hypothetical protein